MSSWFRKAPARRAAIREGRPDLPARRWEELKAAGVPRSLGIAAAFCLIATAILMMRQEVVRYRPGQYTTADIVSRVNFTYHDKDQLAAAQRTARERRPRVYKPVTPDPWQSLEEQLLSLPDRVATASSLGELPEDLRGILDSSSFTRLKDIGVDAARPNYEKMIKAYVSALRRVDPARPEQGLYILPDDQRKADLAKEAVTILSPDGSRSDTIRTEFTYSPELRTALENRLANHAKATIEFALQPKVVALTLANLKPTHVLDEAATTEVQNRAEAEVPQSAGDIEYKKNQVLVPGRTEINDRHWQLLRLENNAFLRSIDRNVLKSRLGMAGIVVMITVLLSAYIAKYQPRVIRKHARAMAIAALLLSMLLLAQIAGIGSSPLYVFAIAPTILVAMILAIAYDARFAVGISTLHAMLVTLAVGESFGFFIILLAGIMACCFLMGDIRTRSRLIEVGGATALALMLATAATGAIRLDPLVYIGKNALFTGAAGLAVGFIVLGILPFIEKAFRITTSMTLLELADVTHPLLRRLSVEAPGTYNHSLQVATIAEAAAEAIGVNSLLCRVASYYHDVGKINKAEYFVENQQSGENRHINLSPNVSLLIIIGHVKDGIEMAREYNLPTSLFPFIQQHHGTTLVEYFYHQACNRSQAQQPGCPAISEAQYRYPGPKPRSKEVAVVMIADAVESAARTMTEPSASRIEALVHDLVMKRLLDGQLDECDLSMRELDIIERTCVKTMLSIYHGRIAYPSTAAVARGPALPQQPPPAGSAARSA